MLKIINIINISGNRNRYTLVREKLAIDIFKRVYGKIYFYAIRELCDDSGFCTIENITYDRLFDTFIYVIKDCSTNHTYITERCNLYLIEADREKKF